MWTIWREQLAHIWGCGVHSKSIVAIFSGSLFGWSQAWVFTNRDIAAFLDMLFVYNIYSFVVLYSLCFHLTWSSLFLIKLFLPKKKKPKIAIKNWSILYSFIISFAHNVQISPPKALTFTVFLSNIVFPNVLC